MTVFFFALRDHLILRSSKKGWTDSGVFSWYDEFVTIVQFRINDLEKVS